MKNEKLICRAASCIAAAVMAIAAIGAAAGVKDKNVYVPDESGTSDGYSESDAAGTPEGTETRPNASGNTTDNHGRETTGRVTTDVPNGSETEREPTVETSAADTEKTADSIRDELVIDGPYREPSPETSTVVIQPETETPETAPLTAEPPLTGAPATGTPTTGTPVTGEPATGAPATGETTETAPLTTDPVEADPAETDPVETTPPEPDPAVTEPVGGEAPPEMNEEPG